MPCCCFSRTTIVARTLNTRNMPDSTTSQFESTEEAKQDVEREAFKQRAIKVLQDPGMTEMARQVLAMPREGLLVINRGEVTTVFEEGMLPVIQYLLKYGDSEEVRRELERELMEKPSEKDDI